MVLLPGNTEINKPSFYYRISDQIIPEHPAAMLSWGLKIKVNNQNFATIESLLASEIGQCRATPHTSLVRVKRNELSRLTRHCFRLSPAAHSWHTDCSCNCAWLSFQY